MNFSQMKDERLLLFYDAVRQQVSLDGNSLTASLARASAPMPTSFAKKWKGDGLTSRRLIGEAHDRRAARSSQWVRELVVIGIDNAEKAFTLF